MANNPSAKKRIQVTKRNCLENKYYKTSVRTLKKRFFTSLNLYQESKTIEHKKEVDKNLRLLYSFLDKGTKKNIFHKNTTSRQKARFAQYLKKTDF